MTSFSDFIEVVRCVCLEGEILISFATEQQKSAQLEGVAEWETQIAIFSCGERKATDEALLVKNRAATEALLEREKANTEVEHLNAEKKLLAAEEKLLKAEKEKLAVEKEAELQPLKDKAAVNLVTTKQRGIAKEDEERLREEKNREFPLCVEMKEGEGLIHTMQLDFGRQKKQIEFKNMLERAKIEQETAVKLWEIDTALSPAVAIVQKDKYIPKRPFISDSECLYTALNRFCDRILAARVPEEQWVSRLRNLLENFLTV